MNECKGWFGKIFGHKFESKIQRLEFNRGIPSVDSFGANGYEMRKFVESFADKKYKIVCKRCGVNKNE